MPSHHLINFEIEKYYQNELKFNGIYSRNDGCESTGSQWIAFYVND